MWKKLLERLNRKRIKKLSKFENDIEVRRFKTNGYIDVKELIAIQEKRRLDNDRD